MVTIRIEKRHLYFSSLVMGVVIGLLMVNAYNPSGSGGNPAVFGHSIDEIDWSKPILGDINIKGDTRVDGDLLSEAVRNTGGAVDTYYVNNKRYHVATKTSTTIDGNLVNELCRDEDGCTVSRHRIEGLSKLVSLDAPSGVFRFYIDAGNYWTSSVSATQDTNGNNAVNAIVSSDGCTLSDGDAAGNDAGAGYLDFSISKIGAFTACVIDFDD